MKKVFILLAVMIAIGFSIALAGDQENINALSLPDWAKWIISTVLGIGAVGSLVFGVLKKVIPGFEHSIAIIKKLLKIYTSAKPILQDTYVVNKYGDTLGEINTIIDEVEEFCNDTKINKKKDFLEKWKIKTVDSKKVMAALKASPILNAANEALK